VILTPHIGGIDRQRVQAAIGREVATSLVKFKVIMVRPPAR
jgi:phosphoglycerate dehydrogenase-like enzyme